MARKKAAESAPPKETETATLPSADQLPPSDTNGNASPEGTPPAAQLKTPPSPSDRPKIPPVVTLGPYWTGAAKVEVCVWSKEQAGPQGAYTVYWVTVHREYRKDEQWYKSDCLRQEDLPYVQYGLQQAWAFIANARRTAQA